MATRVLFPFIVRGILLLLILAVFAVAGLWSLRAWIYQQLEDVGIHSISYRIDRVGLHQVELSDVALTYTDESASIPMNARHVQLQWSWTRNRLVPMPQPVSLHIQKPHITLPLGLFKHVDSERIPTDTLVGSLPAFLQTHHWLQQLDQLSTELASFNQARFADVQIDLLPEDSSNESYPVRFSTVIERVDNTSLQIELEFPQQRHAPTLNSTHDVTWRWRNNRESSLMSEHNITVYHHNESYQGRIHLNAYYQPEEIGELDILEFDLHTHIAAQPLQTSIAHLAKRYSQLKEFSVSLSALPVQSESMLKINSNGRLQTQFELHQWPKAVDASLSLTLDHTLLGHLMADSQFGAIRASSDDGDVGTNARWLGDISLQRPHDASLTLAQLRQSWPWLEQTMPQVLPSTEPQVQEDHIQLPSQFNLGWVMSWSQKAPHWSGELHTFSADSLRITVPDYAASTVAWEASALLSERQLDNIEILVNGEFDDLAYLHRQKNLNWPFTQLQWRLSLANESPISLESPLVTASQWLGQLQTQSNKETEDTEKLGYFSLNAPFQLNLNPRIQQDAEMQEATLELVEAEIALQWEQARIDIDSSLRVSSPNLRLKGVLQPESEAWHLRLTEPLRLKGEFHYTPEADLPLHSPFEYLFRGDSIFWSEQGILAEGRSELNLPRLTYAPLIPQQWRWSAHTTFASAPFQVAFDQGELASTHGMRIRHQGVIDESTFAIDWNLTDIFFLAGNPIARAWSDWPELLQLQRGRMGASGRLTGEFESPEPSFELEASLQFMDAVGIYDTTSFGGLNGEIQLRLNAQEISASTPNLRLLRMNQGIDLGPFLLRGSYQLTHAQLEAMTDGSSALPLGLLTIDESALGLFGGFARLQAGIYELSGEPFVLPIELVELDLNQVLTQYPAPDLTGTGRFSGMLPLRFSEQGISIERGTVTAIPPGGILNYRSERATAIGRSNPAMRILTDAFDHFEYERLDGEVIYQEDGSLELVLRLHGQNPQMRDSRPIHLNLSLQENLPALITGLQLSNKVNDIIHQRVQQKFLETVR